MSYHAVDFAKLLGVSIPKAYYWIRKLGIDWRDTDTYSKLVKACEKIKYELDNPTTRVALAQELEISLEAVKWTPTVGQITGWYM